MAAACTALEVDVARLRSATYVDHLELIRLAALVDGLVAQLRGLSAELAALRRELSAARSAPVPRDPLVEVLATEVSELRATVATQQAMLADLTRRMLDLLERTPETAPPAALPAAPPAARPAEAAAAAPAPALDPATRGPDQAPAAAPARPDAAASSAARPFHDPWPHGPSAADEALDDETVLRLRLIPESSGR